MTTQNQALLARLIDGGPIEAVMGDRWTPSRLPEQPTGWPAGVYQRISAPSEHTHDGAIDQRTRRYQLTIYDPDYSRGDDARAVIVAELDGTRGAWGDVDDVTCMVANEAEDIDPVQTDLYRQRIDLFLTSTAA